MIAVRLLAACAMLPVLAACRAPDATPAAPSAPADAARAPAPSPQAAPSPAPTPAPAAPAPVAEDWTLPGRFDPTDTQATLEQRFGKAQVRRQTLDGPEGEQVPALIVFPDDPQRRLEIGLDGEGEDARISAVTVRERSTRWRMQGLRPGMPLAELVAANGAPVGFYGFSWDYGGSVDDWLGGKLANPVGAPSFHHIVLEPADPSDSRPLPQGDASFRSDDPNWPGLGKRVVIGEISVSWPDAND